MGHFDHFNGQIDPFGSLLTIKKWFRQGKVVYVLGLFISDRSDF
jgi:hypothetical protein